MNILDQVDHCLSWMLALTVDYGKYVLLTVLVKVPSIDTLTLPMKGYRLMNRMSKSRYPLWTLVSLLENTYL